MMSTIAETFEALWPAAARTSIPPSCFTVGALKDGARRFAHIRLDAQPPPPAIFGPAPTAGALIERAAREFDSEGADVYFSLAATTPGLGSFHRGTKSQLVAVPGFGIDFDIAGPGHQSTKLPADEDTIIREYLAPIRPWPTRIHRTAGGVHVFWLFDAPIIFATSTRPGHRLEDIQALSTRWQDLFRAVAQQRDEHLDATSDLTRIFRMPGTHNHKLDSKGIAPRPVTVAAGDGERVTLDQIRAAVKDSKPLTVGLGAAASSVADVPAIEPWTREETLAELPKRLRVHAKKRPERAPFIEKFLDGKSYSAGGEHHVVRQRLVSWIAWLSEGRADVGAVCELNSKCYEERDAPGDAFEKFEAQLTAALTEAATKIATDRAQQEQRMNDYRSFIEEQRRERLSRRLVP